MLFYCLKTEKCNTL